MRRSRPSCDPAVWKRIVVIAAGPLVNIVLAIVIVWVLLLASSDFGHLTSTVGAVTAHSPAASVLRPGDQIIAADGARGVTAIHERIATDRCAHDARVHGCRAQTPVQLLVRRRGRLIHLSVRPEYATLQGESGMFIGIDFHLAQDDFVRAGSDSVSTLWHVATASVSAIARIFEPKERKQLSGVVGTYDATAQSFHAGAVDAIYLLALISLSLGVINLFPFLPLDGGHIFWAVAEKVRGKRIPFAVMERAGIVGFVLILALFAIGLSNDVTNIAHGTFNVH
jgi:regulator of sigma E protease